MKTKKQITSFLRANRFVTEEDYELVSLYCQSNCGMTPKEFPDFWEAGEITAQMFLEWFKNGFGIGDIARDEAGCCYMVANSSVNAVSYCAKLSNVEEIGKDWKVENGELDPKSLAHVPDDVQRRCVMSLGMAGHEMSFDEDKLVEKYIPAANERVEFFYGDKRGLGVVRSVSPSANSIELYCYFDYDTKKVAYSMHEPGICDVYGWHFKPMSIICQRRLNRELNRFGKVWNEKLHRIEPINPKVEKGKPYYYISDKMTVVTDRERETRTSHCRYLAGNYFTNINEANDYLGKINELLRDRLAK